MDTTKTKTHAGPLLGSRWAQMWAYMWAEQLVIFWYMLPKVTYRMLCNAGSPSISGAVIKMCLLQFTSNLLVF